MHTQTLTITNDKVINTTLSYILVHRRIFCCFLLCLLL